MNVCLLIKTNSVYSYLWPIIEDYIKDIKLYKVLAYNEVPENKNLPKHFHSYIKYDQNLNFSRRLLQVIPKINFDYILFVSDVDIIINLNVTALYNYVKIMEENNIDRVHTAVFDGYNIKNRGQYSLCNLNQNLKQNTNHFYPYDCGSAIWNKNKFIQFLNVFIEEGYSSLELSNNVQNYCKTNLSCFGIQLTKNTNIKYNRGLTYTNDFSFLHITTKGKFLKPIQVYGDYERELKDIIKKYNLDVENIGIIPAPLSCLNYKKLQQLPAFLFPSF
jgi:hypothetical protein